MKDNGDDELWESVVTYAAIAFTVLCVVVVAWAWVVGIEP